MFSIRITIVSHSLLLFLKEYGKKEIIKFGLQIKIMKTTLKDLTGSRTIFSCGYMSGHSGFDVKCQGLMRLIPMLSFLKLTLFTTGKEITPFPPKCLCYLFARL